ncbi:MAG: sulfatase [Cyclobacteriaceae bacterium]|nr:sulfatase [Cyclobacteriaceae bacterium]MDH4298303.1 sulfatase [Cyclobacteriaceae bacterium]MDH5249183.1 sulfatase [Cyclobacteriaceae bacterium]
MKNVLLILLIFNLHAAGQQRPNIVVVIADDHTMQAIGAYGARYGVSPNIDQLAKEGVLFNRAFVTNSICAPSRAVLVTGQFSHKNGHINNLTKFDGSQDQYQKRLQQAGYQTAWIGKWHLESTPQGFDYWEVLPGQGQYYNPDFLTMDGGQKTTEGYCTNIITNKVTDWLDQRDKSKPFSLVVGHKATHRTWMPDTADLGATDQLNITLPENFYDAYAGRTAAEDQDLSIDKTMLLGYDLKMYDDSIAALKENSISRMNTAQRNTYLAYYARIKADFDSKNLSGKALTEWKYQRYMRDYLATAISLDRNVGRLMQYLKKNNLLDNTMIVYTSDQGFYLGEHGWFDKRFMYEESMRTPMIIRYPPLARKGTVIQDLVMNLDMAPTFLQLAGVAVPESMQGKSILPLLAGEAKGDAWRTGVYYHYYEHPGEHNVYRHFGIRTSRYKLIRFYGVKNFWELYDLRHDPHEMRNLAGEMKHEKLLANLKRELQQLIRQYEDVEAAAVLDNE